MTARVLWVPAPAGLFHWTANVTGDNRLEISADPIVAFKLWDDGDEDDPFERATYALDRCGDVYNVASQRGWDRSEGYDGASVSVCCSASKPTAAEAIEAISRAVAVAEAKARGRGELKAAAPGGEVGS